MRIHGQAATATIAGTVTDSSGAAIPGATVNAKNNGTGVTRSTVSDGQGRYIVADLASNATRQEIVGPRVYTFNHRKAKSAHSGKLHL